MGYDRLISEGELITQVLTRPQSKLIHHHYDILKDFKSFGLRKDISNVTNQVVQ